MGWSPSFRLRRMEGPRPPAVILRLSKGWVDEAAKIWGAVLSPSKGDKSLVYQIRVLGDFPSQGADNLIPLPAIEAAVENSLTPASAAKRRPDAESGPPPFPHRRRLSLHSTAHTLRQTQDAAQDGVALPGAESRGAISARVT